jgi:monovalent cation/hydrogen antiporter
MVRAVIEAPAPAEILRLRSAGLISNEIMHRVERELDLEDGRLDI